jgi:hypothetical protein
MKTKWKLIGQNDSQSDFAGMVNRYMRIPIFNGNHAWVIMTVGLDTRDGTMIKSRIALLFLLCLGVSAYAQGSGKEMFSWTDEEGVVHFTDQRPAGQDVTVHQIPDLGGSGDDRSSNLPPAGEGRAVNQGEESQALSPADQRREEMAERRKEILAAREKNEKACTDRRAEVERLEPHRRVYFTNEEGETERMDDVVRTDRVAEAKAYIAENCN